MDPNFKKYFTIIIILVQNLHHTCIHLRPPLITKTKQKKNKQTNKQKIKNSYYFNMATIILIFISQKRLCYQNLKNHFQRNLAQSRRIWIDLHYWHKVRKKLFYFKMAAKTIFITSPNMLVYTITWKWICNWCLCNYKKEVEIFSLVSKGDTKNKTKQNVVFKLTPFYT